MAKIKKDKEEDSWKLGQVLEAKLTPTIRQKRRKCRWGKLRARWEDVGGGVPAVFFEGLARVVRKQKGGGRKKKGGKRRKEGKKRRRKVEAHYRWACVSKLPKADLKEGKKKKRRSHVSLQSANIENVFRHCGVARARAWFPHFQPIAIIWRR